MTDQATTSLRCPRCGAEHPIAAAFCSRCGIPTRPSPLDTATATSNVVRNQEQTPTQRGAASSSWSTVLAWALCGAALLGYRLCSGSITSTPSTALPSIQTAGFPTHQLTCTSGLSDGGMTGWLLGLYWVGSQAFSRPSLTDEGIGNDEPIHSCSLLLPMRSRASRRICVLLKVRSQDNAADTHAFCPVRRPICCIPAADHSASKEHW